MAICRETAFVEVTRGFQLAMKLQNLIPTLQLDKIRSELAKSLHNEILRCLKTALSALHPPPSVVSVDQLPSGSSGSNLPVNQRRPKQRRDANGVATKTTVTRAPYDDGYHWRKYGQKDIKKSNTQKSYYRCANNESHKCPAKKQVQQDSDDPCLYHVTYYKQHNCSDPTTTDFSLIEPVLDLPQTNSSFRITYRSDRNKQSAFASNFIEEKRIESSKGATTSLSFASRSSGSASENPVNLKAISTSCKSEEINTGNQLNGSCCSLVRHCSTASIDSTLEPAAETVSWIDELLRGITDAEETNNCSLIDL